MTRRDDRAVFNTKDLQRRLNEITKILEEKRIYLVFLETDDPFIDNVWDDVLALLAKKLQLQEDAVLDTVSFIFYTQRALRCAQRLGTLYLQHSILKRDYLKVKRVFHNRFSRKQCAYFPKSKATIQLKLSNPPYSIQQFQKCIHHYVRTPELGSLMYSEYLSHSPSQSFNHT